MLPLRVHGLSPQRVVQAYPLVQLSTPGLSLDAWQRYAQAHLKDEQTSPRGILVIDDDKDHIAGLFGYSVDEYLRCGRILMVKDLIAVDLFSLQRFQSLHILLEAVEKLANRHDCDAIHAYLNDPHGGDMDTSLLGLLAASGYQSRPWGCCKRRRETLSRTCVPIDPEKLKARYNGG